jgi:hypothetical protein
MVKTFSFIFVLMFLVSCGKSGGGGGQSSSTGDEVSMAEISTNSPVPSAAQNFDVNLKLYNFSASQEDKILVAGDLIKKVVATEEFKNAIINHTYKGKKTFVDNGGHSNSAIYKKIIEGSEKLRPGIDNEMDLDLVMYHSNNSVVGYTMPSELKVWMNSKFFNKNSPAKVTTNMMHEWLHKLGFKHAQSRTTSRPYSVPYAVGYLVAKLAKKFD